MLPAVGQRGDSQLIHTKRGRRIWGAGGLDLFAYGAVATFPVARASRSATAGQLTTFHHASR